MKEKKVRVPRMEKKVSKKDSKSQEKDSQDLENEDFDFGGIPKDVSFKRNIGCGG